MMACFFSFAPSSESQRNEVVWTTTSEQRVIFRAGSSPFESSKADEQRGNEK